MSDVIFIRYCPERVKTAHAIAAAALGVSLNTYLNWILEETAAPYEELRIAIELRAQEVAENNDRKLVLYDEQSVPQPRARTRPIRRDI